MTPATRTGRLSAMAMAFFLGAVAVDSQVVGLRQGVCSETASPLIALTVVSQRDLGFGDVLPGINNTVSVTDAGSGKWRFDGDPSVSVTLTFTVLPSTLISGGNNLTLTYGPTDAAYNTVDDPATATLFDPAVGATGTTSGSGVLFVWLGARATPSPTQPAGSYSDTITLDGVY